MCMGESQGVLTRCVVRLKRVKFYKEARHTRPVAFCRFGRY